MIITNSVGAMRLVGYLSLHIQYVHRVDIQHEVSLEVHAFATYSQQ